MTDRPVAESQVTDRFTVCNECGGAIPDTVDRITGVNGTLIIGGAAHGFQGLDFCCTAHMAAWVGKQPQVPTPNPPYPPPPGQP